MELTKKSISVMMQSNEAKRLLRNLDETSWLIKQYPFQKGNKPNLFLFCHCFYEPKSRKQLKGKISLTNLTKRFFSRKKRTTNRINERSFHLFSGIKKYSREKIFVDLTKLAERNWKDFDSQKPNEVKDFEFYSVLLNNPFTRLLFFEPEQIIDLGLIKFYYNPCLEEAQKQIKFMKEAINSEKKTTLISKKVFPNLPDNAILPVFEEQLKEIEKFTEKVKQNDYKISVKLLEELNQENLLKEDNLINFVNQDFISNLKSHLREFIEVFLPEKIEGVTSKALQNFPERLHVFEKQNLKDSSVWLRFDSLHLNAFDVFAYSSSPSKRKRMKEVKEEIKNAIRKKLDVFEFSFLSDKEIEDYKREFIDLLFCFISEDSIHKFKKTVVI